MIITLFPSIETMDGSSNHSSIIISDGGADNAGSKSKFQEKIVPSSAAQLSITVKVHSPFREVPNKSLKEDPLEAP